MWISWINFIDNEKMLFLRTCGAAAIVTQLHIQNGATTVAT